MPSREERLRILVTGAGGFVGRHLLAHLLAENTSRTADGKSPFHITAAIHTTEHPHLIRPVSAQTRMAGWNGEELGSTVETALLDITEAESVETLLRETRPQQVYHLAARASGADTDREAVYAVNVTGTRLLLEAAATLSPFPRVLIASTGYVYGDTNPMHPASEEDPVGPLWRYGAYADSKMEMETVARAYRGLAIIARAFAHTGPGQPPVFAIPAFARQLARMERGLEPPILRVGNLSAQRDLLDVRDVVRAYSRLMAQGVCGEAYNIATGKPIAMHDALDHLRALCAVPTTVTVDPERLRPAEIACSTGTPMRLWTTTGWQPRLSLEQTLTDTLNYWRAEAT